MSDEDRLELLTDWLNDINLSLHLVSMKDTKATLVAVLNATRNATEEIAKQLKKIEINE